MRLETWSRRSETAADSFQLSPSVRIFSRAALGPTTFPTERRQPNRRKGNRRLSADWLPNGLVNWGWPSSMLGFQARKQRAWSGGLTSAPLAASPSRPLFNESNNWPTNMPNGLVTRPFFGTFNERWQKERKRFRLGSRRRRRGEWGRKRVSASSLIPGNILRFLPSKVRWNYETQTKSPLARSAKAT